MNNTANMYIYNNQKLMTNYIKKLIKIGKSIADKVYLMKKRLK